MIKKLLSEKEGERLDFKQKINNLYKTAKAISAFANTSGGRIVIGISDDRTVAGIDPEEEKYMVQKAAGLYCQPPVPVTYKTWEIEEENKSILIVTVAESHKKPHYITNKQGEQIVYIRCKDKCLPAGKNQILLIRKGNEKGTGNVKIGKNEKKLLDYLQKHDRITAKEYMQLVNISRRRAARIIHELLLNGLIKVLEHEKENYYTL